MTDDLTKLLELARAATPGPWSRATTTAEDQSTRLIVQADNAHASGTICRVTPVLENSFRRWAQEDMGNPERHEADAAFIAAANPEVVAALVESLQAANSLRAALPPPENISTAVSMRCRNLDDAMLKLEAVLKGGNRG